MFEYPALYSSASQLSENSQRLYFGLVKTEYILLIFTAVLSLRFSKSATYFAIYASVFFASLAVMVARNWRKPEQDWYRGRALAESIKTSCWRYCMRAEPFINSDDIVASRAEFRNHLSAILEANRHIGHGMPAENAANDEITESMDITRALSLDERKALYMNHRIHEQRKWYAAKAGYNKRASNKWLLAGVIVYTLAILLLIERIVHPEYEMLPIDPLIVSASCIVGWTQMKKFNELSSSYVLTAHEIGIIQSGLADVSSDSEFSIFVNDAEQAFSREHTQWVARQQSA